MATSKHRRDCYFCITQTHLSRLDTDTETESDVRRQKWELVERG